MTDSTSLNIGYNEIGMFVGDGDSRIQFTAEKMDALIFANIYSKAIADSFVNYCKMTFASGSIPTCFRQDLSSDEIHDIHEELIRFADNFSDAMFANSLIFEL